MAGDRAKDILDRHFANEPAGLSSILGHLLQLTVENQLLLEEIMADQSNIDAQTSAITSAETTLASLLSDLNTHIGNIQSEVQTLKGQGINTGALDAAVGNLQAVLSAAQSADAAAQTADTAAAPAAPAPAPTAPAPVPAAPTAPAPAPAAPEAPTAPAPAPAAPTAAVAMDPADNKPLYTFTGPAGSAIDTTVWIPSVDVKGANGEDLYTFVNDTPGGAPTGASADWAPYTGTPQRLTA